MLYPHHGIPNKYFFNEIYSETSVFTDAGAAEGYLHHLYKGLEHPGILVWQRVLAPNPRGYLGTAVSTLHYTYIMIRENIQSYT